MESTKTIKVDIVSDVACPWCYVGKRRLEAAMASWNGVPIEVEWHPYQLDPTIPEEGMSRRDYLVNKFGSIERIQPMLDNLAAVGKEVGIDFNFGAQTLSVNTLPLHQLLHVAGKEGFKDALKERFLKANFEDGVALNDLDVITDIVSEFGWDRAKVEAIIQDPSIAQTVKDEISFYQQRGVTGVPFFVINDQYGLSGAQPSDIFLKAFEQVAPQASLDSGARCELEPGSC